LVREFGEEVKPVLKEMIAEGLITWGNTINDIYFKRNLHDVNK